MVLDFELVSPPTAIEVVFNWTEVFQGFLYLKQIHIKVEYQYAIMNVNFFIAFWKCVPGHGRVDRLLNEMTPLHFCLPGHWFHNSKRYDVEGYSNRKITSALAFISSVISLSWLCESQRQGFVLWVMDHTGIELGERKPINWGGWRWSFGPPFGWLVPFLMQIRTIRFAIFGCRWNEQYLAGVLVKIEILFYIQIMKTL